MEAVKGHPIFGSLREFRDDRAGMQLDVARHYGDICRMRFGFVRSIMVQSPALANEVLSQQNDAFVKTPGLTVFLKPMLGKGLLSSEHAFHAKQRKLLAPAFAHKRVAAYAPTMAERAARLQLAEGEVLDVSEMLMRLTLEIVGKTLFDVEIASEAEAFGEAVTTAMQTLMQQLGSLVPLPPPIPTLGNLKTLREARRLDKIVYRIIDRRRREGHDRGDLLSVLLEARDEAGMPMSDRQVRDEAMTLFLAGHETTANALSWTLYLLSKNPAARERLEGEVDALGRDPTYEDLAKLPFTLAALKESMRLYPPAYLIARRSIRALTLGGHEIPKHMIVMVNVMGIHRRPDLYDEPESYRPERFLGDFEKQLPRCGYLPFGAGPRICIGNHFALMEGQVLLATLLRRYRFELAQGEAKMEPLVTLRPLGGVRMRVRQRPASAIRSQASSCPPAQAL